MNRLLLLSLVVVLIGLVGCGEARTEITPVMEPNNIISITITNHDINESFKLTDASLIGTFVKSITTADYSIGQLDIVGPDYGVALELLDGSSQQLSFWIKGENTGLFITSEQNGHYQLLDAYKKDLQDLFANEIEKDVKSPKDNAAQAMQHAETTEGDFIYRLITEKEEYNTGDSVEVYAELEYIGDKESITIYHAASPFMFPIFEKTRSYAIGYGMDQPLLQTSLKQGEPLREVYRKNGGYSEQDEEEYVRFMKNFFENGFPSGHYVVDGAAEFYVQSAEDHKEDYLLKAQIEFRVKD